MILLKLLLFTKVNNIVYCSIFMWVYHNLDFYFGVLLWTLLNFRVCLMSMSLMIVQVKCLWSKLKLMQSVDIHVTLLRSRWHLIFICLFRSYQLENSCEIVWHRIENATDRNRSFQNDSMFAGSKALYFYVRYMIWTNETHWFNPSSRQNNGFQKSFLFSVFWEKQFLAFLAKLLRKCFLCQDRRKSFQGKTSL